MAKGMGYDVTIHELLGWEVIPHLYDYDFGIEKGSWAVYDTMLSFLDSLSVS